MLFNKLVYSLYRNVYLLFIKKSKELFIVGVRLFWLLGPYFAFWRLEVNLLGDSRNLAI